MWFGGTDRPSPVGQAFASVRTDQHTDASGRKLVRLELRERTTISVDLPLLALSRTAQQQQGGVIVVVPWEEAPKVLP